MDLIQELEVQFPEEVENSVLYSAHTGSGDHPTSYSI
jgi:hypothetical protein